MPTGSRRILRAVILDFDGLILDTETAIATAWREEYERHGVGFDLASFIRTNVGTVRGEPGYVDEYGELERLVGAPVDREAIRQRRVLRHAELLDGLAPNPGVDAWLDRCRDLGLRLGVASSSPRDWVVGHLSRLGRLDRFHAISCRDDVGDRAKPDPAVYRRTLEHLGVAPPQALAVEDSAPGVAAARAAGIATVAVPSAMTAVHDFSHADHVVASLDAVPLDHVAEVLGFGPPGGPAPAG